MNRPAKGVICVPLAEHYCVVKEDVKPLISTFTLDGMTSFIEFMITETWNRDPLQSFAESASVAQPKRNMRERYSYLYHEYSSAWLDILCMSKRILSTFTIWCL